MWEWNLMDNGGWLFGFLNLVYWDEQGWMKIMMHPISAKITKMEVPVDTIEEEEGVQNTFK